MPIPFSRHGDSEPLVTTPSPAPVRTGLPGARYPRPREGERDERLLRLDRAQRLGPDEARIELAAPAEAGLQRIAILGQVVAVEVEADLEPQRVARAEPGRHHASRRERIPDGGCAVGAHEQLRAVLARVAGAAHQAVHARDRHVDGAHAGGKRTVGERLQRGPRRGALHGDHGPVFLGVRHLGVEPRRVVAKPGQVLVVIGGVRDGQEPVRPEPVGEQVVQHAAVVPAEHRVLGAALRNCAHVVGEQALEQVLGAGPAGLDLAHVRDVEHAGARAHRPVLGADPLVLHRHLPAGEGHQPRAGPLVALEQGGTS